MTDKSAHPGGPAAVATSDPGLPPAAPAHDRDRRQPPADRTHGPLTLLDAFEGRRQLIAYYFVWDPGHPAAEQCEGCTFYITQVSELSYLHSCGITHATFCQDPYDESVRYRDFMGWDMPWYSALDCRAACRGTPGRNPRALRPATLAARISPVSRAVSRRARNALPPLCHARLRGQGPGCRGATRCE